VRIRLLVAGVFMLVLPIWLSPSKGARVATSTPFATAAFAGHTLYGGWCECGAPGCICDPGEEQGGQSARPEADKTKTPKSHAAPIATGPRVEFAFGTGALMLVFALLVWSRLRA
jgi:hypothetical protein